MYDEYDVTTKVQGYDGLTIGDIDQRLRNTDNQIMLTVPFDDKDEVKSLEALWSPEKKKWYVPSGKNPAGFLKWVGKDDLPKLAPD